MRPSENAYLLGIRVNKARERPGPTLGPRPDGGTKGCLPVQLAPYGPVWELVVVDVYVVASRVLPQLPAQRAGYLSASAREAVGGRLEGRDHGAGLVAETQMDVGRRGGVYVLGPERVAHLGPEDLHHGGSAAVFVSRPRHLLLARQLRPEGGKALVAARRPTGGRHPAHRDGEQQRPEHCQDRRGCQPSRVHERFTSWVAFPFPKAKPPPSVNAVAGCTTGSPRAPTEVPNCGAGFEAST